MQSPFGRLIQAPPVWLQLALVLLLLSLVGLLDWISGSELSMLTFYLMPISLATWWLGFHSGLVVSIASIGVWTATNFEPGQPHASQPFLIVWNSLIALAAFVIVTWLLHLLKASIHKLEERVEERTRALQMEMIQRQRLEQELIDLSEREQERIGHDLHDSLCQHLAAMVLAAGTLEQSLPESAHAARLAQMIQKALEKTRQIARGLYPLDLQEGGLCGALESLAVEIEDNFRVEVRVYAPLEPELDSESKLHLYRIAQEAISNAIRHGRAPVIELRLEVEPGEFLFKISDQGLGFSTQWEALQENGGLGLRIMEHRTRLIGADFHVEKPGSGGCAIIIQKKQA